MHLVSWLYSAIFGSAATSFDSTDESIRYHTYAGACWVLNSPAYLWFPASEVGRCPRIPRHSLFVVVGAGWFFHPFRQCLWPWLSFTLPCAHRNVPWRSVVPCGEKFAGDFIQTDNHHRTRALSSFVSRGVTIAPLAHSLPNWGVQNCPEGKTRNQTIYRTWLM